MCFFVKSNHFSSIWTICCMSMKLGFASPNVVSSNIEMQNLSLLILFSGFSIGFRLLVWRLILPHWSLLNSVEQLHCSSLARVLMVPLLLSGIVGMLDRLRSALFRPHQPFFLSETSTCWPLAIWSWASFQILWIVLTLVFKSRATSTLSFNSTCRSLLSAFNAI